MNTKNTPEPRFGHHSHAGGLAGVPSGFWQKGMCQHPLWDEGEPFDAMRSRFCGEPVKEGSLYCQAHAEPCAAGRAEGEETTADVHSA